MRLDPSEGHRYIVLASILHKMKRVAEAITVTNSGKPPNRKEEGEGEGKRSMSAKWSRQDFDDCNTQGKDRLREVVQA